MTLLKAAIAASLMLCISAAPAGAATTQWMTKSQLNGYAKTSLRDQWYPTRIQCRQGSNGPQFRLTVKSFSSGNKPFHKWNWVEGKASDLSRMVSRLKRSDRPDLKYRIVHKTTYKNAAGVAYGCAIAMR